jgi:hypothetical protein
LELFEFRVHAIGPLDAACISVAIKISAASRTRGQRSPAATSKVEPDRFRFRLTSLGNESGFMRLADDLLFTRGALPTARRLD